jgi:tetratricopeptide (TPR) repeat protein
MFVIALIAIIVLCLPAFAQKTAEDWAKESRVLLSQGRLEESNQAFDMASRLDPNYVSHTVREPSIRQAYDRFLRLNPNDFDAWYYKGLALYEQSRLDEAFQALDRATQLNPIDFRAWEVKGSVLDELGWHEEALQAFDRAIQLSPNDANFWYNKSIALNALGRYTEADAAYARAGKLGYTGPTT